MLAPENSMNTVIKAEKLNLTFQTNDGPVHALSNIDLAVDKGEFVSLIGPSGCGKTTLLRVIADLEKPTDGTITVNGMNAAMARATADQWDFDITVVRAGRSVYRILTAMPRGATQLQALAAKVRNSFRQLTAAERRQLKPLTLRSVKAQPGESTRTMAARMEGVSRPLELFLVLNGMKPGDSVEPGRSYKVVSES